MFSLPEFKAYPLFQDILKSSNVRRFSENRLYSAMYGTEGKMEGGEEEEMVDDRALFCFFKKKLEPGTLELDIGDTDCSFIVKLID